MCLYFQGAKSDRRDFFCQMSLNKFHPNSKKLENLEFRNLKMWAWPNNGPLKVQNFEKSQFSRGHFARLQNFYINIQV